MNEMEFYDRSAPAVQKVAEDIARPPFVHQQVQALNEVTSVLMDRHEMLAERLAPILSAAGPELVRDHHDNSMSPLAHELEAITARIAIIVVKCNDILGRLEI